MDVRSASPRSASTSCTTRRSGDNLERIVETLRLAASRADVVLVCGGLGPTEDDITRDAIAALAGVPLVFHEELETMLREKFRRWSAIGSMPESNLRQASVPEGARWIVPDRGTAPGLIVELADGVRLYAVPGVPDEMREMVGGTILPELRSMAGGDVIASQVLRVAGLGESAVAERLADLFADAENPTIAYLASMGEVKVRLTAKAPVGRPRRARCWRRSPPRSARASATWCSPSTTSRWRRRCCACSARPAARWRAPSRSRAAAWASG